MIYEIPEANLSKLEKQINKLKNKGANITFEILEPIYKKVNNIINYKYYPINIEGKYRLENWEYLGSLEHLEEGNIIKLITNIEVPNQFKTCKPICEHCNKSIFRTKTYLVKNINTNEIKQIGSSCLKDYTGLDSEQCALYLSYLKSIKEFQDEFLAVGKRDKYIENDIYKQYAYKYIKEKGYDKLNIVNRIDNYILENKDINEDLTEVNTYIDSLNENNSTYYWNVKLAWKLDYIKENNKKLICSAIYAYIKHTTEIQNNVDTHYVGNIGDIINIKVNSLRVLYTLNNRGFSYYANDSTCYEIVDVDGNYYIWTTTKRLPLTIKSMIAKVKDFKEYKGIKQTVITRAKYEEPNDYKEPNYEVEEIINNLFKEEE